MTIAEAIAQHVLEVHEGNNWTEVNIAHTLQGVTVAEANTLTAASPNTIAALVRHLTYWNGVMARRAQGVVTDIGSQNGFDGPALRSEKDWAVLQSELRQSAHALAAAIRAVSEAALAEPMHPTEFTGYKNLQGAVEHLHYHLGQLVLLKNLVRHSQASA